MSEPYPKPKTVAELLEFCSQHNMPLRKMRFFIGEDYPEPKAFGIFQDAEGDFIVYKNKADGSRAVRYKGPDEAFAVNEIYQKLKDEVDKRRSSPRSSGRSSGRSYEDRTGYGGSAGNFAAEKRENTNKNHAVTFIILAMIVGIILILIKEPVSGRSRGYYLYDDNYYYYDNTDWYYYSGDDWYIVNDRDFSDMSEHFVDEYYSSSYGVGDFTQSEFYDGYYERSADYGDYDNNYDYGGYDYDYDDYDWDYDYDDWDYGDTDWDDDW